MRDVVRGTVLREQKGGHGRGRGVVSCRGVVFEEVEEGEGGEEEGGAPEWVGGGG